MGFFYVKAFHIIFVVTWFSGLFYLGRLFIYNREAQDKDEQSRAVLQEQFGIMIYRLLFIITLPSAILTLIFGGILLYMYGLVPGWLWLKLFLVLLLYVYHISMHYLYQQHKRGIFKYSSYQLRMWNEVPAVFLVAIVMLVVVKQNLSAVYGLASLFGLIMLLMLVIKRYKKYREKHGV